MALPFFYSKHIGAAQDALVLDEITSKHVIQVLRMKVGEQINLTDGNGNLFLAEIIGDHKKKCEVKIRSKNSFTVSAKKITIAISPVKNTSRFEWFLEKATEIGVTHIIPLLCERTEKQHFRWDRMQSILISAMLQSQQTWLPVLAEPTKYAEVIKQNSQHQKFIAHCVAHEERCLLAKVGPVNDAIILIGPEGDFVSQEIESAIGAGFKPVSLGETRLRTETAGIVAATLMANI